MAGSRSLRAWSLRGGDRVTSPPPAAKVLRANGCLVTPGLINTHHHIFQNLTRSYKPAVNGSLFQWLSTLYPLWAGLDEEAVYASAWVGLAELALGGCTTSTDHLYVHPAGRATCCRRRSPPPPTSACGSIPRAAR